MLTASHTGFSISFVCGVPGAGKSYICTRDVIRRLVETDVRVITNLPLEVEAICETVAQRRKCDPAEVLERIKILPSSLLSSWQRDDSGKWSGLGPWDLVADARERFSELILDECHLYCPKKGLGILGIGQRWIKWLGEARHEGWARIVFITQDESKVGDAIRDHAELRFELTNTEKLRDPLLRIPMGDWYEVFAALSGKYLPRVAICEYRRVNGRLKQQHVDKVRLDPEFFRYYRSHQAAGGGAVEGVVERPKREFEKRSRVGLLAWFFRRHAFRFIAAAVVVCAGIWFCFLGGVLTVMESWLGGVGGMMAVNGVGADVASPGVPASSGGELSAGTPGKDQLAAAMATVDPVQRKVIEAAFRATADELRSRRERIDKLEATPAESPELIGPLPLVQAFVGNDAVYVEGRLCRVGEALFFDQGKRRVTIRRIDRKSRVVYLDDSRVLRFSVPGVSVPGGQSPFGSPTAASPVQPTPVRPVGQPTESARVAPAIPAGERSIVVDRQDAGSGVLPLNSGSNGPQRAVLKRSRRPNRIGGDKWSSGRGGDAAGSASP